MTAARRALLRRAFADARVRTYSFAGFFLLMAYIQPTGYRSSFPTLHDRMQFALSFAGNKAIRLFYGTPHDLLSTGGYTAWRVGGTMSIVAAAWGLLAAVRAMRAEEESGLQEIVLSMPVAEKMLRPFIVYIFLVLLLRVFGKRELAQLNPFDLVVLLSLSNTVQNAIIGDDNSVGGEPTITVPSSEPVDAS